MNKREMAKALDEAKSVLVALQDFVLAKAVRDAANTLLREAEREEQERPKVTLAQLAGHIQRWFTSDEVCDVLPCPMCSAAFDVLRKLDTEGGEFLQEIVLIERLHKFLRSLGVEPKP